MEKRLTVAQIREAFKVDTRKLPGVPILTSSCWSALNLEPRPGELPSLTVRALSKIFHQDRFTCLTYDDILVRALTW